MAQDERIFILPAGAHGQDLRIVSLPHPKTGNLLIFLRKFSTWFKMKNRRWNRWSCPFPCKRWTGQIYGATKDGTTIFLMVQRSECHTRCGIAKFFFPFFFLFFFCSELFPPWRRKALFGHPNRSSFPHHSPSWTSKKEGTHKPPTQGCSLFTT